MKLLIDKLQESVLQAPDDSIYIFIDGTNEFRLTNKVLYTQAIALAQELKNQGLKKSDRAIILSTNSPDNIWSIYGCMMAGVVFTLIPPPLDPRKRERLHSVVQSFQPSAVIVNKMTENLPTIPVKIIMADRVIPGDTPCECAESVSDDLVYVQYSSGSTSAPKGVKVSAKNLTAHLEDFSIVCSPPADKLLAWVPFYHNIGLVFLILKTYCTGRETYIFSIRKFLQSPLLWLKAISDYKPQITVAPNSAYDLCVNTISDDTAGQLDLSSLRLLFNGSEVVNPRTMIKFAQKFSLDINTFAPSYGLAEAVCTVSSSATTGKLTIARINDDAYKKNQFIPEDTASAKEVVSLGTLSSCLQAVIVNPDTLEPCRENEIGELCLAGDSICDGYWEDVADNDNFNFFMEGHTHEGLPQRFLRTGDMAAISHNELYITGRLKELIIINGQNYYPNDIISAIKEAVPALAPHAISTFSLLIEGKEKAVICIETAGALDFAALACQINAAAFTCFEFSFYDILFLPDKTLPRTDNGKIRIPAMRKDYEQDLLSPLYARRAALTLTEEAGARDNSMADELETAIKACFNQIMNPDEHVAGIVLERGTSFLELGGNSFDIIELAFKLENRFHVPVNPQALIVDPTVSGMARYIQSLLINTPIMMTQADLKQDCVLPDDIYPAAAHDKKASAPASLCRIFLTGASGFLGAHLIAELLCSPDLNAIIYCHVRAETTEAARAKIKENMAYYRLWQDSYEQQIIPVLGDLRKPLLGIEEPLFKELAQTIDVIYHNGALVSFLYAYAHLKSSNVDGTIECLRLACRGKAKRFHYISTFSVYDNPSHFRKTVYEDDPLDEADGYMLGYSESKWVSEKLVREASQRGLAATIFRPGNISGSSKTGIWKLDSLASRLLVSYIQTGTIPDSSINTALVPVDYVSSAIVRVSQDVGSAGKAFNLVNSEDITSRQLMNMLRENGCIIEAIPYDVWQAGLFDSTLEENALKALDYLFKGTAADERSLVRRYADLRPRVDMSNTLEFLKDSQITCPSIDDKIMGLYFSNFKRQIGA